MNSEVLIPGLRFARKHSLTPKEVEVLILFLERPLTIVELSKILEANKTTLHHVIQRLKLKKLLILKNRDSKGVNLYEFDVSQLKE